MIVLTSHDRLGETGKPTGCWLEEFAALHYVFLDAVAQVTLASPKGGPPPLDPASEDELERLGGLYRKGADWQSFILEEDGGLITG